MDEQRRRSWQETFREEVFEPTNKIARFIADPRRGGTGADGQGILQPPRLPSKPKHTNTFGVLLPSTLFRA
jgi:hypothetical protein